MNYDTTLVSLPNAATASTATVAATGVQNVAPGAPAKKSKMRETCHPCAVSKVKCSKEKPACARCAKRGIACEYIVSKRQGRKRNHVDSVDKNTQSTVNVQALSPPSMEDEVWNEAINLAALEGEEEEDEGNDGTTNAEQSPMTSHDLRAGSTSPLTWPAADSTSSGGCHDLLMSGMTPLSFSLTAMTPDLFSPMGMECLDTLDLDSHLQPRQPSLVYQGSADISSLLLRDKSPDYHLNPEPLPSSSYSNSATNTTLVSSIQNDRGDADTADSSCCCLSQALEIMSSLSSSQCTMPSGGSDGDCHGIQFSTQTSIDNVVTRNKEIIEALHKMLHGSCQENVYLLTSMSMIMFKVMEHYGVAAMKLQQLKKANGSAHPSGNSGKGKQRLAVQKVLGELHLVQRLVNQLSSRLRARDAADAEKADLVSQRNAIARAASPSPISGSGNSFSMSTLSQMESDLRKCLSTLSSNIINILRHI